MVSSFIVFPRLLFDAVFGIEAFEEAAFIYFSNHARVDEIFHLDVADARILAFHKPLQNA